MSITKLPIVQFNTTSSSIIITFMTTSDTECAKFAKRLITAMLDAGQESVRKSETGVTTATLREVAGVTNEMARRYTLGKAWPEHEKLVKIAKWLGVREGWLRYGELPMKPGANTTAELRPDLETEEPQSKFANIPFLDIELAAGNGFYASQERTQDLIPISKDWIFENNLNEGALKAVTVRGDSMSPRIQDGDILLINTDDKKPKSGNVYAIAVDDELRVKRLLKRMDNNWIISSDNKSDLSFVDEVISHHNFEQLRIIGRAVKVLMGDL